MVVGEGKRQWITVVLGCGRGRAGGFSDERLWEIWRGAGWWESQGTFFGSRGSDLSFGGGSHIKLKSSMFLESLVTFPSGPYTLITVTIYLTLHALDALACALAA